MCISLDGEGDIPEELVSSLQTTNVDLGNSTLINSAWGMEKAATCQIWTCYSHLVSQQTLNP